MKYLIVLCLIAYINAFPQKDGAQFTNEAIKQAQSQQLIPAGAQIQNVQEGIELGAYENIPGSQRVDLFQILGDQVPREVITNLQSQIDNVGRTR
uniref:CSON000533 protein n=2 Tax=Culicoides sonorensis TaxID=179676 RepID=A0A336MET2_CULSO